VTSPIIVNDTREEPHDVIEQPDLRLKQERPEVPDDRRRQHHRQEDDGRPCAVAGKPPVDQQRQTEAEHDLEQDRPEDEMRGRLHRRPDI
jgi:hypothetical protein